MPKSQLEVDTIEIPSCEFPDRMSIFLEKGPQVEIIKSPEGFIIDAYNPYNGECIGSITVWNDDMEKEDD